MNTHRAVIESPFPPMLHLVAAGPRDFCEESLARWVTDHPLAEHQESYIFRVVEPATIHQDDLASFERLAAVSQDSDASYDEAVDALSDAVGLISGLLETDIPESEA